MVVSLLRISTITVAKVLGCEFCGTILFSGAQADVPAKRHQRRSTAKDLGTLPAGDFEKLRLSTLGYDVEFGAVGAAQWPGQ